MDGNDPTTRRPSGGLNEHSTEVEASAASWEDWAFSCVVVHPYGRPLEQFRNVTELLEALRDAIRAHRSLYQDGGILHQDISINNIIITEQGAADEPKGMLIDLDVSMELKLGPVNPNELIGTRPFMAVGLLEGKPHTYRHDMEPLLYVLLWSVICRESDYPPTESRLRPWCAGSFDDLACRKLSDMEKHEFTKITAEIPAGFEIVKQLAEDLRQVLFPERDGVLFTGTDTEPAQVDGLYEAMVDAFGVAIAALEKKTA